jgi:Tfp pilus assembly protein PilN
MLINMTTVIEIFKAIGIVIGACGGLVGLFSWVFKKLTQPINDQLTSIQTTLTQTQQDIQEVKDDIQSVKQDVATLSNRQTELEHKESSKSNLDTLIVKTLRVLVDESSGHTDLSNELYSYLIEEAVNN